MTLPEDIDPGDPGHIGHHEELHRTHNAGPSFINVRDPIYGAVGDGVTNDSAAIVDALTVLAEYGIVRVPAGEYLIDPGTLDLLESRTIQGDGADSTWFTLTDDSGGSDAALQISVPTPGGSVRGVYGPRIRGIGINLANAPSATGIRVGIDGGDGLNSGWTWLDDIRVEGGTVSFDCQSTNTKLTNFHLIDPTDSFIVVNPTGQEFRCWDGVLDCTPGNTVAVAVDIPILVHGAAGAVYMRDVALNNGGTVSKGIDEHGPSGGTASVPLRLYNVTLDNLAGVGLNLEYVTDCQMIGGWINSAAGTGNGAIRFLGGGRHTIIGVEQLNGGSGSACSFDFAGGGTSLVTLVGNTPATGVYYRISGTPPTNLKIADNLNDAAVAVNITNDWAALRAALSKDWTMSPAMQEVVHVVGSGGGEPAFANSWAAAGSEIVYFWKDTVGVVHLSGPMTGGSSGTTAFTLPVGYRPFGTETFNGGEVTVGHGTGEVRLYGVTISVSGITFRQSG